MRAPVMCSGSLSESVFVLLGDAAPLRIPLVCLALMVELLLSKMQNRCAQHTHMQLLVDDEREKTMLSCCFVRLHRLVVLMLRVKSSCFASERNLDVHVGSVLRYTVATLNGS